VISYLRDHPLRIAIIIGGGIVLGIAGFVWATFSGLKGEDFDPAAAAEAIGSRSPEEIEATVKALTADQRAMLDRMAAQGLASYDLEQDILGRIAELNDRKAFTNPDAESPLLPDGMFDSYLLIGADASGALADTVILGLIPSDGGAPMMASLPRDLYVRNPCTSGWSRLNTGLGGCKGFASGLELVALMVQGYTGIEVDHTARVTFEGFAAIVDAMGGATICPEYATRDVKSGLDIAAGCQQANGQVTLAWVRSRSPEQLIDGSWQRAAGSDFDRQARQQDVLFQLVGRIGSFGSLDSLSATLSAVASYLRLDSSWGFADALATAWTYRGISRDDVHRLPIPVSDYRTSGGAQVLIPTRQFNQVLAAVYPAAAA
jgi:LCP family protein required for cell wall assembly